MVHHLYVDLGRFTGAVDRAVPFTRCVWFYFTISTRVFTFLDPGDQIRCSLTCVVIQVDRIEVALGATELRLELALSSWSVPTPPLAAFSLQTSSNGDVISDSSRSEAEVGI